MRVYIAGPLTLGDPTENLHRAIDAADMLLRAGHHPYLPHLNMIWNLHHHHSEDEWLDLDFKWLQLCDVVLRLPGKSIGADREEAEARRLGIPVVEEITDLALDAGHPRPA